MWHFSWGTFFEHAVFCKHFNHTVHYTVYPGLLVTIGILRTQRTNLWIWTQMEIKETTGSRCHLCKVIQDLQL
jgi:hypothetical protein